MIIIDQPRTIPTKRGAKFQALCLLWVSAPPFFEYSVIPFFGSLFFCLSTFNRRTQSGPSFTVNANRGTDILLMHGLSVTAEAPSSVICGLSQLRTEIDHRGRNQFSALMLGRITK